jgi:cytochrome P450
MEMMTPPAGAPVFDADPFSAENIKDPYSWHGELRDAGPLVWLSPYNVWATGRYAESRTILNDWETYCSGAGVGLANFHTEEPWRPPSLLLEADPPKHTPVRDVAGRVISHANLRKMRPAFEEEAAALVDRLLEQGEVDGVTDIAQPFILKVFPDAIGVGPDNREHLLLYGNMAFNAFGPLNEIFEESMLLAEPVSEYVMACCTREELTHDGLGAEVYTAADAGEISDHEALFINRSYLGAGLDTTVDTIGNALNCFACWPEEWDKVHGDPTLVRSAIEEVMRYDATFQAMFRTTTCEAEIGGVVVDPETKILVNVGSANRDPAKWENPDVFDIDRRLGGHLGFGIGIHNCVGQAISRMELEALFAELARRVERFEIIGTPERRLNNTLHGFGTLPLKLHPA